MVNTVDDTVDIYIQVQSQGELVISNINAPSFVELKTPFTLTYTVRNTGETKTIYGVIIDSIKNNVFFKSYWSETFAGEKTVSYLFERGTTANMGIKIQIGVV
jgi:hypothetical protein